MFNIAVTSLIAANQPRLKLPISFEAVRLTTSNFTNAQTEFSQKRKKIFSPAKNIAPRRRLWLHLAVPIQTPAAARHSMKVLYSGRVQGVGFRYTARTVAAGFEITGTVRNLPDGRVELLAEGDDAELEAFRAAIRSAVLAGFIKDESVEWSDAQNKFSGFEITQ